MPLRGALVTLVLASLVLAGCSDGRPSDSRLGRGVELLGIDANLPEDVDLDCVGAELNDSGGSREALDVIASATDDDPPRASYAFSEKDQRLLGAAFRRAAKRC